MIIRKAERKDFNSIIKLDKDWKKEDISWGIYIAKDKERIKDLKKNILFVAEADNKIIAYVECRIITAKTIKPSFEIKKGEKYGELLAVYICKEYRNKHLGKGLVKTLISYFNDKKIKKITLKAVNKDLDRLVNYYKQFGFKPRLTDMILE